MVLFFSAYWVKDLANEDFKDLYESVKNQQSSRKQDPVVRRWKNLLSQQSTKNHNQFQSLVLRMVLENCKAAHKAGVKGKGMVLGADQLEVTELWSQYWLPEGFQRHKDTEDRL